MSVRVNMNMVMLPDNIIGNIVNFLDGKDIVNLMFLCRCFYKKNGAIRKHHIDLYQQIDKPIESNIPEELAWFLDRIATTYTDCNCEFCWENSIEQIFQRMNKKYVSKKKKILDINGYSWEELFDDVKISDLWDKESHKYF